MTTMFRAEIERRARVAAAGFVEEFNEPLDPAETDWDATAWETDGVGLDVDTGYDGEAWAIYQAALVAETKRLCMEAR